LFEPNQGKQYALKALRITGNANKLMDGLTVSGYFRFRDRLYSVNKTQRNTGLPKFRCSCCFWDLLGLKADFVANNTHSIYGEAKRFKAFREKFEQHTICNLNRKFGELRVTPFIGTLLNC
jgi:hypothetical protein